MQHQGDYNSSTTPYYYPPNPNPNPTTDFHHLQPPPYASAPPFTAAYHPQPPPPPPSADYYLPYHPTDPIPPTAPPSYPPSNPNNINNLAYDHNNNNINSSYDHHLNFPPPPPQKWILGKMLKLSHASTFQYNPNPDPVHDANYGRSVSDLGGGGDYYVKKHDLGMSSGDGGTCSKSSTCKVFDDDFGKAVPKVDVEEGGVKKFRVKWLAESGGQSTMDDVLCQIGVDGIRMLDPSTSRTLRIYPLDTITRCEVYDSSTFAFWSKSTVDIEPRRIRLQSNSYTTNTLLDTVTVATIQVKEMGGRSRPVDTVKVTEQSTEKKKGLGEEMNIIKPPNEEKHHWVPYEAVTKCSGCGGDFRAFNRKHHCRNCGDIFCDKCTHGRIALTSEDKAPQVRGDIKCRCDNVRRSNHNRLRFAQGQSRSAAKRRARHLGRCVKCGNFSHDAACPENRDDEFLKLCFDGPIRCYTERLLHPRGYAHARMISEVDRLTEEAKERNYFIK